MDRREAIAGSSRHGHLTRGTNPHQTTTTTPRTVVESTSRTTRASASSTVPMKKGKASAVKEREASKKKASLPVKVTPETTDIKASVQAEQVRGTMGVFEANVAALECSQRRLGIDTVVGYLQDMLWTDV
jgi:hypothetical protein